MTRVTRGRALRLGGGLAALAAAVTVALVAEDVRRWPDRLERGDVAFASSYVVDVDPWVVSDSLPLRPGEDLLAVQDDLKLRRALQLVRRLRRTVNRGPGNPAWVQDVRRAQRILAEIEDDDPDDRRRSAAANVLGYVYFESSQTSGAGGLATRAALDSFRHAVLLDPDNDDAKYNLELLMYRLRIERSRIPTTRIGPARERGEGPALNLRGSGY